MTLDSFMILTAFVGGANLGLFLGLFWASK
jgi:hypothetical protein